LSHSVKVPESTELRKQLAAIQEQLTALEAERRGRR
jgi:hypothetical protein